MSSNPAQILGLKNVRGSIKPGLLADLIIWKPEKTSTTLLLNDSPYAE